MTEETKKVIALHEWMEGEIVSLFPDTENGEKAFTLGISILMSNEEQLAAIVKAVGGGDNLRDLIKKQQVQLLVNNRDLLGKIKQTLYGGNVLEN